MTVAAPNQGPIDAIGATDPTALPVFDAAMFGPPPLLAGEDANEYMALFRSIATTVQPTFSSANQCATSPI